MTRPLRRRTAAVTSLVLVALALGACESSSTGSSPGGSAAETGRQIFASSKCRACHTLAAAGSNGNVGPNLNSVKPSSTAVVSQVTNGGGGMLSFKGQLATAQIAAEVHSVTSVTLEVARGGQARPQAQDRSVPAPPVRGGRQTTGPRQPS